MAKYQVQKTDGQTGQTTNVGAAVKTGEKARDLVARVRAQQTRGSSNSFTVKKV